MWPIFSTSDGMGPADYCYSENFYSQCQETQQELLLKIIFFPTSLLIRHYTTSESDDCLDYDLAYNIKYKYVSQIL